MMSIKQTAKRLRTDIPAVFLAMKHSGTPWYARLMAAIAVGYTLSPIDLIPDFIPLLGYLDDLILLPLMIWLTIKLLPSEVMQDCRAQAADMWSDGKPKRWYYAVPIVLFWLIIIWIIIKCFFIK